MQRYLCSYLSAQYCLNNLFLVFISAKFILAIDLNDSQHIFLATKLNLKSFCSPKNNIKTKNNIKSF